MKKIPSLFMIFMFELKSVFFIQMISENIDDTHKLVIEPHIFLLLSFLCLFFCLT